MVYGAVFNGVCIIWSIKCLTSLTHGVPMKISVVVCVCVGFVMCGFVYVWVL